MRQGAGAFKLDIRRVLADERNDLTTTMRRLLRDLAGDLEHLEKRIKAVTDEIDAVAAKDDAARRLMSIPGIGTWCYGSPLCNRGCRQICQGTGPGGLDRARPPPTLNGRTIEPPRHQQARKQLPAKADHLWRKDHVMPTWTGSGTGWGMDDGLRARMHPNKAIVAVAAKIARIAWVIITNQVLTMSEGTHAFA